jgi:hypothetical protein
MAMQISKKKLQKSRRHRGRQTIHSQTAIYFLVIFSLFFLFHNIPSKAAMLSNVVNKQTIMSKRTKGQLLLLLHFMISSLLFTLKNARIGF